jgi:hypothetical protein
MLRFLSNVFSRKTRKDSSPKSNTSPKSKTKRANSPPKSILKKSASTRKKSLSFSSNIKSVREYAPEHTPDMLLKSTPMCNPPQRPKKYPCRIKNSIFENIEEFNEYARDVSDTIINRRRKGLPSVSSHYKTMKNKLKESGSYRKKVPEEYRFYDEDSGRIVDVRLFPNEDEE